MAGTISEQKEQRGKIMDNLVDDGVGGDNLRLARVVEFWDDFWYSVGNNVRWCS